VRGGGRGWGKSSAACAPCAWTACARASRATLPFSSSLDPPNHPPLTPPHPTPPQRVIEINLVTDPAHVVDISEGAKPPGEVSFSYSVTWEATAVPFEDRLARYERLPLNPVHLEVGGRGAGRAERGSRGGGRLGDWRRQCTLDSAPHTPALSSSPPTRPNPPPTHPNPPNQIHWFSIVNSCITVLLLTGFLATILLRVLRADFVKFSQDPGEKPAAGRPQTSQLASQRRFACRRCRCCCRCFACRLPCTCAPLMPASGPCAALIRPLRAPVPARQRPSRRTTSRAGSTSTVRRRKGVGEARGADPAAARAAWGWCVIEGPARGPRAGRRCPAAVRARRPRRRRPAPLPPSPQATSSARRPTRRCSAPLSAPAPRCGGGGGGSRGGRAGVAHWRASDVYKPPAVQALACRKAMPLQTTPHPSRHTFTPASPSSRHPRPPPPPPTPERSSPCPSSSSPSPSWACSTPTTAAPSSQR
jgi:hypothetical protein